jgi:hypothetical protein
MNAPHATMAVYSKKICYNGFVVDGNRGDGGDGSEGATIATGGWRAVIRGQRGQSQRRHVGAGGEAEGGGGAAECTWRKKRSRIGGCTWWKKRSCIPLSCNGLRDRRSFRFGCPEEEKLRFNPRYQTKFLESTCVNFGVQ